MSRDRRWQSVISFGLLLALAFLECSIQKTNTVQHVVVILKENHTFDNYFGTFPGADGATTLAAQSGGVIDNVSANGGGVACDGTPTSTVPVIDANGNRTAQSPCFDFTTLADLLGDAGL